MLYLPCLVFVPVLHLISARNLASTDYSSKISVEINSTFQICDNSFLLFAFTTFVAPISQITLQANHQIQNIQNEKQVITSYVTSSKSNQLCSENQQLTIVALYVLFVGFSCPLLCVCESVFPIWSLSSENIYLISDRNYFFQYEKPCVSLKIWSL